MKYIPPAFNYLKTRLTVDVESGRAYWIDATKHHAPLNGKEAGSIRAGNINNKHYWHIKIDGTPFKRSHIVFLFATGQWPKEQIDHINGNSLDDRITNLREATQLQNSWNHKTRAKKEGTPMGIRKIPSGKYQARIACNKKQYTIGVFAELCDAVSAYQSKRKELFGEYA